jgi:hypothetical protein
MLWLRLLCCILFLKFFTNLAINQEEIAHAA